MTLQVADLLGSWQLVSWRVEYSGSRPDSYPFGSDATGLLMYAADGWMCAQMSQRQRSRLSAPSARIASTESKARALDEYLAYAGTWSLQGDTVRHQVKFALNPVLIGTEQVREGRLVAGRLALMADEQDGEAGSRRHLIEWQR